MSGPKPSFRFTGKRRELLDALRREQGPAGPMGEASLRIPRREGSGPAPLSFAQQRLWFLDQLEPGGAAYNLAAALGLSGPLDVPALAAALRGLVLRHEALRTTFPSVEGEPAQSVAPEPRTALPVIDLGGLDGDEAEAEADRIALSEAVRPFDLAAGPLLRSILVRRSGGDHRLVVVLHHIVADGWSRGILLREVGELYDAAREGRQPRLPGLPIQYADYAVWQRGRLQGETLAELLDFWRERLAGLAPLDLPADRPRPAMPSGRGGQRPVRLAMELAERLRTLAHGAEATLFMVLLAGWDALLLRHGSAPDVAVGAPVANRDRAETAGLIGFFVNTLVLRADLSDDPAFGDLLDRVRRETLEALARQEVPFEKLVEELQPDRDLGRQPLFQVMLTLLPAPPEPPRWGDLGVDVRELPTGTAKVDLLLALEEGPEGVAGTCEHSADLFDDVTVDRLIARLEVLLESATEDPSRRISELNLLPVAELLQILADAETPDLPEESVDPSKVCLHTLVALQAARTPDAVAVEAAGESLTYLELAGRAARLADHLRDLGVGPEVPVALCLERSPDLVVAVLAVLQAGGAYVPIDPAYPRDRQAYILDQAGAPILLTQERLLSTLPVEEGVVPVLLDAPLPPVPDVRDEAGPQPVADNLAYVLYTSGSTGRPKGVAVRHRSAVALVRWARQLFLADDLSAVLAATSVCFDLSVFELFAPLASGGKVVLAEDALALPALRDAGVRLVNTVPSAIGELLRTGGIPESVRTINLAGEPLAPGLAARLYELPHVERVYNLYGPTEDTTYSTASLVPRGAARVSIGRPLPGTRAHVLDRRLRQAPPGVPGELYLGGAGLARGYLGRPDLTAERFVPDPFAGPDELGRRLYRTGDLVRTLRDGSLEFLGRLDHQVKVRGFRIELGEIEEVLRSHPAVRGGAVLAREDRPGETRLVAYAAMDADRPEGWPELRSVLASRLPEYMIPAAFVRLEALPLTPSGKVDRKALPAPVLERGNRPDWEPPRTPLEELVAGCWADLLGVARVGLRDNFFELGGHSLLAARVVARLRAQLGAELPVRALFEEPTVAGIAARVEATRGTRPPSLPPLRRSERAEAPPLSFAQERLWFLSELEPGSPLYNLPAAIRLRGALDPAALAGALRAVVRRHEALRTAFRESGGGPVQAVAPDLELPLALIDLSALPADRREPEASRLRSEEARRGFDLHVLPLVRATLQRLDEGDHVLVLSLHHAVADGWSLGVLAREIRELLDAAASGRPAALPELPVQYADFAVWQRGWLRGEALEALLEPWRRRLAGAPGLLPLPTDRPRTALVRRQGSYLPVELPGGLSARLEEVARRSGATPFMVLLAAFQTLLGRTAGEDDVSVGFPVANRGRAEVEGLIGFFVNTLVLRTRLDGGLGFAGVLARVREAALEALAHQDLPFERLVEELRPGRDMAHTPLFQVLFVLQNTPPRGADPAGLELSEVEVDTGAARFDLTLTLAPAEGAWRGRLSFDRHLFDAVTVRRLAGRFERLLEAAVHDPSRPVADLPLLAPAELHQVLREWNDDADARGGRLHEAFEVWARRTPDAPAVVGEDGVLTWRELDRRANGLAHELRALGVGPESRVALCAERSAAMIAGLLAILKAGAAYVPLDPSSPRARLTGLLEDCGAAALVAHRHLAALLEDAGLPALLLDGEPRTADAPPPAGAFPESPAYVIYTSGSTGRPKGVVVEHRQAVNYLRGAAARLELEELPPGTSYATVSTLAADLGNTVVFASLALGGVLHVIPRERVADAEGLGGWFEEHGVDVLKIVPSHLAALLSGERPGRAMPRRRLVLGGERSESAWVEGLRALAPECRIFNHYGPTETTVGVIAGRASAATGSLPLGRPLAGSRILLLDRDLQPVPAGVPGGLYVAGAGLARGYLGRPDLTAERFIPNPLPIEAGERLYATGDLARALPDGRIEFLGRVDDQVKIRGYRVEPGEVEAALGALPGVREAAVLARTSGSGTARLVAWVVPGGPGVAAPELRAALARTLPEALVPAAFVFLDALPLTPNGKLDRRALPEPPEEAEEPVSDGTPRTPLEELLAAAWAELLGRGRVGIHDDFFDLGGHSLLATRAISRVRAIAGWTVPLRALFETRTVAGLARWIGQSGGEGGGAPAAPLLEPVADGSPAPLSFAQERLWFLDQLEPGSALYNLPYFARVQGPLDPAALERALGETVRRHESLRTVFPVREGAPVQEVLPAAGLPLPAIDLSGLAPEQREAEARRLMEAEARRPFDLERGPMARASLVRLGGENHLFLLSLHHIVSDAWSRTVLSRELAALYAGSRLPPLPVQYGDFARWQRSWLRGEALETRLTWWRERLEGAPSALQLPWDRPLSGHQRWTGATVPFALPPDVVGALEERARREGVTLFMLLLGVFQVLLHRVSGQDDVVVGTAVAGRDRSELEGLVGFFVNALPLRARFADEPGLAGHLAAVRETALGAYAHQDLPFEKLVEALGADRAAGLPPVFQVVFALQNVPESAADLGGAALRPLDVHTGTAKFPLTLSLAPVGGSLAGAAELAAELFDTATVERLLGGFRAALEAVAAGAAGRIGDLPLLGEAERRQLLQRPAGLPAGLDLLDLFEDQVDTMPDAVAVACGEERLTWAELDRRANRLAHRLIALGAGPDVAVGLALERSAELVTAILATVKTGGFYVPLDPALPRERLERLAAQAGVRIALAQDEEAVACLRSTGAAVLAPEGEGPEHRPARRADGANLLYVMYTSGSTGEPKGVAVTRANVVRLVWDTDYCRFAPDEVFLLLAPIAFDASTFELWGALSSGARLAVMPGGAFTLHELERAVLDHGVTTLWLTAGLFHQVADERPEILRPLRQLLAGGDVLSPEHVRRTLELAPACRLINGYGPTEGTTFTTCHAVERGQDLSTVPIGQPIARTSVRVLDRYGALVPAGVPGELYAGGDGLARGYLGRPDLTAERFVPDPFGGAGERLYRTGDLVRRRPDGEIEFLGRIDGQIKLRGFRIEPGEIEVALVRHPAVREAVVLAREERPGDRRLVAWVVPEDVPPGSDELRAFLRDRLPAYMVPSAFVSLDALPLTPNGKVDRRALPVPLNTALEEQAAAAPRTPMEELVAGLFADVLGVREVGTGDDFFALGGHSLLATRLLARVRESLGAEVPLRDLFEAPTVERFAARVDAALAAEDGEPEPPPRRQDRPGTGDAPLSFAQQRLWFLDRLEPGSPLYNIAFAVRAHGPLRPEVLEASLAEVVRRHDALRTVFPEMGGDPRQVVRRAGGLRLPVVDLGGLGEPAAAAEALRLARAEAARPFDLARGPLLRAGLLRLGADRHWLAITVHHVVFDGWSIGVLAGEMAALYAAFEEGRASPLPGLPLQYADFAAWQRRWLEGERLEAQAAWWRRQLAGSSPAELPTDRPRPAVRDLRGAALSTSLSNRKIAALQDLARRRGATLFMVLLAALQALVRRHGGPRDAAMGSPIAGRRHRDVEGMIGFFVNTLVLRQELPEDAAFDSLVERAREVCLDAYRHQDVPFERVVEEAHPERDLSRTPLFQILFALQTAPAADLRLGDLILAPVELEGGDTGTAKFDVQLTAAPRGGGLDLTWTFATSLYDPATIRRLAAGFRALLAAATVEPGLALEDLPLLDEAERHQILVEWNDTALTLPHGAGPELLHELFLAQAWRTPSAIALVHGDESLTYRELAERSERLAARLRALGAGPERRVGVCLGRTPDLLVALLAVLRSGAAYVPLDPAYPQERLEGMLGDSQAAVLLTETALAPRLAGLAPSVLMVDGDLAGEEPWTPALMDPGNLAYVIYTSGSTGRPKGVAIEHRAAVAFVRWALSVFEAEDFAGVLAATSICFDLSVFEMFAPLACGGTVILAENALALPATAGVRLVNTVPSAVAELLRGSGLPPSVRTVNLAGEALPAPLARDLHALGVRVFNLYGPTEDTTYSTGVRLEPGAERPPTIGRPIADGRAFVLDSALRPVPLGAPGEVWLGGAGLARGYLGRPDLTAERFLPDPHAVEPGARLYRTGDLARLLPDGRLDYLGRSDHQVKIRGFRIELGEVEAMLAEHSGVEEAVVLAEADRSGTRRLVAWVVPTPGATPVPAEILAWLRQRLPTHAVPSRLGLLEAMPRTLNGKTDRRALANLGAALPAAGDGAAGPARTAEEEILAGIWQDVLGIERVGLHDSFFELGGHSLLATRVASRLREAFGADVPLLWLFESPTVAALAERLSGARRERPAPPLRPVPRGGRLAVSFAQERIWFLDRLDEGGSAYLLPGALRLRGQLDEAALELAWAEILRRHEGLRTVFLAFDGRPEPIVLPAPAASLVRIDLRALPPDAVRAEADRRLRELARRPMDLETGPLWRTALLRVGDEERLFAFTLHHIVADGWSLDILVKELTELYRAFAERRPSPLPEPVLQYADYAAWQRSWLEGEVLAGQLGWWRERLAGAPEALALPTDRPRPSTLAPAGSKIAVNVPAADGRALRELGRRHGATAFMVLLAAFQSVLARWSGDEDLCVGTPIANRNRAESEGLIGCLINTLVLRGDLSGDPAFASLLVRTRQVALGAYDHQDLPFERLVDELCPRRDLGRTPLFQVMLALQPTARPGAGLPGLDVEPMETETGASKFDLSLSLNDYGEAGISGSLHFNACLFDRSTMERLIGHLLVLLRAAAADPGRRLSELEMLAPAELQQVLVESNDTNRSSEPGLLPDLFAAVAARCPEAAAVLFAGERLTYRELDLWSNRVARRLARLGVGPDVRVGLCLERSPEWLVCALGVLKAGGAYLPLSPADPAERIAWILADAGAAVLISRDRLTGGLETGVVRICLDRDREALAAESAEPLHREVDPAGVAYVIYTSGSTGRPKGVAVHHRGLAWYLRWIGGVLEQAGVTTLPAISPLTFDASLKQLFSPLVRGEAVRLLGDEEGLDPDAVRAALAAGDGRAGINCVPVLLEALLAGWPAEGLFLRTALLGGETLGRDLADRLFERVPGVELWNLYGPTEVTSNAVAGRVSTGGGEEPAIGRPIDGIRAYVLDRALRPAPLGVLGQLYLAGAGVARGYLGRPDLTAASFVPDPFSGDAGGRLYATGDLVRRLVDGRLRFAGRADGQIKIRGVRIEPGEIEAALTAHPAVLEAAVGVRGEGPGARLVAWWVAPAGSAPADGDLLAFLRGHLPEALLPSAFVRIAEIPRTPHGKVDRRRLPEPSASSSRQAYEAPRTPTEEILAGLWAELLDRERVGVHDNFFELGGHSLLATQLVSRARLAFQIENLPLRSLFQHPTVRDLALVITQTQAAEEDGAEMAQLLAELKGLSPEDLSLLLDEELTKGTESL